MTQVTQQDLLEAIREALSQPPADDVDGGYTMKELREKFKVGDGKMRSILEAFQREGKLESVQGHRRSISGVMSVVPTYRIKA